MALIHEGITKSSLAATFDLISMSIQLQTKGRHSGWYNDMAGQWWA
jgi:hypothetical protein